MNRLTKEQAIQKIRHYCGYQERSHKEVKEKLYSYGLWKRDVEEIISQMIEENYLNEERFAEQFAGGKFRMKGWGKVKIEYELKQRAVSKYCINRAMKQIDADDYLKTIEKLADKKWLLLKSEKNIFTRKAKLRDYLTAKGYEYSLITEQLTRLSSK